MRNVLMYGDRAKCAGDENNDASFKRTPADSS